MGKLADLVLGVSDTGSPVGRQLVKEFSEIRPQLGGGNLVIGEYFEGECHFAGQAFALVKPAIHGLAHHGMADIERQRLGDGGLAVQDSDAHTQRLLRLFPGDGGVWVL